MNWYVYCNNNPLMFVDPDGKEPVMTDYTEVYTITINDPQSVYNYVKENMGPNNTALLCFNGGILIYSLMRYGFFYYTSIQLPDPPPTSEITILSVATVELFEGIECNKKVSVTKAGNELIIASYNREVILKCDVAAITETVDGKTYSQNNYYNYRISLTPNGREHHIDKRTSDWLLSNNSYKKDIL